MAMKKLLAVIALLAVALLISVSLIVFLNKPKPATSTTTRNYTYTVINSYPHDPNAFTEGLVYDGGFLFESTGLNGASTLRRINLTSGEVLQSISLSYEFFGEGLAVVNDTLIQLTYKSHVGFVYDKSTFDLQRSFNYATEGWGLTLDGKQLIMSDGSDKLYFLNPETFQITGQIQVLDGNVSITELNELEYVNGDVYANIWHQQKIAIINPETGQVKSWIDLSSLKGAVGSNPDDVLNGIAYDVNGNRLFVTGKDWPQLFEIKLVPSN